MSQIRFDASVSAKITRTDDGRLHCEGLFCRAGILSYRQPDGSEIRELRRPETNQDSRTVESFKFLPVVVEHPPGGLLTSESYKKHAVGVTDSNPTFDEASGGIKGLLTIYDSLAVEQAESRRKSELSTGYTCDTIDSPGVWQGQRYDREQINVIANHLALTGKGRAGSEVSLRLDTDDENNIGCAFQEINVTMAKITCDSVEYEVPEAFASVAAQKFKELATIRARVDSLESELATAEEERVRFLARSDAFAEIIDNADAILEPLGYTKDSQGEYVRIDGKKSKKFPPPEEEEDPEEEKDESSSEEEAEGHEQISSTKKKKAMKGDSAIQEVLEAWHKADSVIQNYSSVRFDSTFSAHDVYKSVLEELEPKLKLDKASPDYVRGLFDSVLANAYNSDSEDDEEDDDEERGDDYEASDDEDDEDEDEKRVDSYYYSPSYTDRLESTAKAVSKTRYKKDSRRDDATYNRNRERMEAHRQPLQMSKQSLQVR